MDGHDAMVASRRDALVLTDGPDRLIRAEYLVVGILAGVDRGEAL